MNQHSTKLMTIHLGLSSNFIKKSLSLLNSPYLFSLLFFFSSFLFLIFPTLQLNFSLSPLVFVLNFSLDRNHMFLHFNGILVILVKSSSSPPQQPRVSRVADLGSEKKQVSEPAEVEQSNQDENPGFLTVWEISDEEEMEVSEFFDVDDHNEDVYDGVRHGDGDVDDDEEMEEEEEEEEEEDGLAAEELNKRCEEFIRRMKQGIISESRNDRSLAQFC